MLTVTSKTEQILREIHEEEPKARYWLIKQFHGQKGYDKMQSELIQKAMDQRKDCRSDVYDYISPKGNRWMVFEHCRYHKDIHYARTMPIAFCYYETYGSVGAFLKGHNQYGDGPKQAVLFTDHFFLRFCARLGIEMRSRWMVQRFLEIIPGIMFGTNGELNEQGLLKVDCRFPASIGRGVLRKDGNVIEIRTYLTDKELNKKQLRETKRLRETADKHNFDPQDVKIARIASADNQIDAFMDEIQQVIDLGVDEQQINYTFAVGMWIVRALCDMGYADPQDMPFWMHHGEANKHLIIDIADHWRLGKPINDEFVDMFAQVLRNDGIKKFDVKAFVGRVLKMAKEDIDRMDKKEGDAS